MRLREMNIYQLSFVLFDLGSLFEKNEMMKKINKEVNEDISNFVYSPELSKEGLRRRQLTITTVPGALLMIVGSFAFLMLAVYMPIFGDDYIMKYSMVIINTFLGSGAYISFFRAWRASLDEIRFKREGEPKDFKLNTRAYIRWYDFLMGIPFGLFSLTWIL